MITANLSNATAEDNKTQYFVAKNCDSYIHSQNAYMYSFRTSVTLHRVVHTTIDLLAQYLISPPFVSLSYGPL